MVPVSWQMGALERLARPMFCDDQVQGEVGLGAGLFQGAVHFDDLRHVRRQEGGRAADQFEDMCMNLAGTHKDTPGKRAALVILYAAERSFKRNTFRWRAGLRGRNRNNAHCPHSRDRSATVPGSLPCRESPCSQHFNSAVRVSGQGGKRARENQKKPPRPGTFLFDFSRRYLLACRYYGVTRARRWPVLRWHLREYPILDSRSMK